MKKHSSPSRVDAPCFDVTIEKLVYGGDGLARLQAPSGEAGGRGKTVLIPDVLPGERVRIELEEESRSWARGRVVERLEAAPGRITPGCEYFGRCGGCQWQYASAATQLEWKEQILRETLRRTGRIDWTGPIQRHAAAGWEYRNRVRLRCVRAEGRGGEEATLQAGYYERNSHRLLPVTHCPISSPRINEAIGALTQLPAPPATAREVELSVDLDDQHLTALFIFEQVTVAEQMYAASAAAALPSGASVAITEPEAEPQVVAGDGFFTNTVDAHHYRVSAGAFFQVNRFLVQQMVATVTGEQKGRLAIDLFAGVGLFTLPLAQTFDRVVAVEAHPTAVDDLRRNTLALSNVDVSGRPVLDWLRRRGAKESSGAPDLVVADPPRTGLGTAVVEWLVGRRPSRIHAISCDPATLARDLQPLSAAGYAIESIHLFDLFPQTYHIETVVKLALQE